MTRRDPVKKEWNDAAESWADFVRTGKDYYRDELNNPAAFNLIGDVTGQLVLDLACGEGYNTRILARKGAEVTGVDFSQKLIELAKREEAEEKLGIRYCISDASELKEFSSNHFDLVTCFMALQDIENYDAAMLEVARVLKNKGRFVFSIPHPCFETIVENGRRTSAIQRYFGAIKFPIQWDMERLSKHFVTTSFHRTITDYFEALHRGGLMVSRLVEPTATEKGLREHPPLRQTLAIPQSMIVESIKCEHVELH